MPKQTIEGQQKMIDNENGIIKKIKTHYKSRKMPEHEKMYIQSLEKKVEERKGWIEAQMQATECTN